MGTDSLGQRLPALLPQVVSVGVHSDEQNQGIIRHVSEQLRMSRFRANRRWRQVGIRTTSRVKEPHWDDPKRLDIVELPA